MTRTVCIAQVATGAEEPGDRLAEPADGLDVELRGEPAPRRAWGVEALARRQVAHDSPPVAASRRSGSSGSSR